MIDRLEEVAGQPVSRETLEKMELFAARLEAESKQQNLVSASTLDDLWERHIIDSAQLVSLAPDRQSWADIGSGAGLPGLVIALLVDGPVHLIEPRKLRAEFLRSMTQELGITDRVQIEPIKAEKVRGQFDVLTARAVASLAGVLKLSTHLSTANSLWVLPKGRNAAAELEEARRSWHIDAESVPSCTSPDSQILVLRRVSAKGKR